MNRLVFAAKDAEIPPAWSDGLVLRPDDLRRFTPTDSVKRAIEWSLDVAEQEFGGVRLVDLLRYDNHSLWWFAHTLFFASAKEAILTIEQSEQVLKEKSADEVLVLGLGKVGEVIHDVCEREGIKVVRQKDTGLLLVERLRDGAKVVGGSFLNSVKERKRRGLGALHKPMQGAKPSLLFLSPSVNWRTVWNYESGRTEKRDVFMGGVMAKARESGFEVVCVDVDYSMDGGVDVLREKMATIGHHWIPFEMYLTPETKKRLRRNADYFRLRNSFQTLSENPEFVRGLQYKSIALYGFLEGRLRRLLSGLHVLRYARILEGAREMIGSERPIGIVMTYETGAYARATILAAQEAGIPTIGIQHGFISPDSAEYMFREASQAASKDGCPIPTKTAVAGSYTSQILTQLSSYPKDSVVVTGYPRHDDFAAFLKNGQNLSRDSLLQDIGLMGEKRTLMFASGGFHSKYGWDNEYDKEILSILLKLASKRSDLQLVVRLHPMEDGKMETNLIQSYPEVFVALVKGERHDLVWASDLFVTVNSSTAIDALIFRKPVFILDVADEGIPTIDLGEAAAKFKTASLAMRVSEALSDPLAGKHLEHIDTELKRHANTVDGKASTRVLALIERLVARP